MKEFDRAEIPLPRRVMPQLISINIQGFPLETEEDKILRELEPILDLLSEDNANKIRKALHDRYYKESSIFYMKRFYRDEEDSKM